MAIVCRGHRDWHDACSRLREMALPRNERRRLRAPLKVIHRHRIGDQEPFERESDLVFVRERAVAILEWIDIGGVRTPLFVCPLDREKLHPAAPGRAKTFYYEDVTIDPRDADRPSEG